MEVVSVAPSSGLTNGYNWSLMRKIILVSDKRATLMTKLILKGSLGNYHLVETEDQSQTLYSEAFGEACHSTHGARAETREIYLEGCHLWRAQKQEFTILFSLYVKCMLDHNDIINDNNYQ